jgi:kynurenine formamidase
MGFGSDRIELECHGPLNTHIDALNHVSIDGHCYSGWPEDDLDGPSVTDLAQARIFTRGVYVDLAAQLGVDWISLDDRISGDDIDGAIANAGVTFERGDALLVDIGRDRFEAEGRDPLRSPRESRRGGLGRSAAEWIADHGVSLLGWDFADSQHPEEPWLPVHALIWALGLVLVDNCHFTELRREFASGDGPKAGALVVAPPQITGGTGALVNPLVIV